MDKWSAAAFLLGAFVGYRLRHLMRHGRPDWVAGYETGRAEGRAEGYKRGHDDGVEYGFRKTLEWLSQ